MSAPLRRLAGSFVIAMFATCIASGQAQTPPASSAAASNETATKEDPERKQAFDLYHAGNFVAALPLLENLSAQNPSDVAIKEYLAFSIMASSSTLPEIELRKKGRVRARMIALEAQKLGDQSGLLQVVLDLPPDGSEVAYSSRKEVDDVMRAAEADFVRGDFEKARNGYLQALLLDPRNYDAALFIGDVYFKQHVYGSAGEWFARAIQIDPDRETAYRYWADALWAMGKSAEAREKYIQAVVANPYDHRALGGLNDWAQRNKVNFNWVRLQDKSAVSQQDDKHINITLDPGSLNKKDDLSGSAWLIYGMNRALWNGEKFKKEFPNEPKYRRTLRQETDSLHLMVSTLTGQKDFEKKKKYLDPSLVQLVQIDELGFLEPFVLLNRADNDIGQDYIPYRAGHRDTIYRYLNEYVVPKAPSK